MHVLLDDDLGRLTVRPVSPWHRLLARILAVRLDHQLASGTPPETDAILAARAMFLTSARYRRALAASLRRMLAASVAPPARPRPIPASRSAGTASQPHVPLRPLKGPRAGSSAVPHGTEPPRWRVASI